MMVRSLLLVWLVGVVAFFILWALLAQVVRRISEKRRTENRTPKGSPTEWEVKRKADLSEEGDEKQSTPENDASEG